MFKQGSDVWFSQESDALVWSKATVISQSGPTVFLKGKDGKEFDKDAGKVFPVNQNVEEDMCGLSSIDEPNILHNLEARALADKPYTSIGPVLVSVNPLKELNEKEYNLGEKSACERAHPFGIAEISFQQMQLGAKRRWSQTNQESLPVQDQSIVVGGESGAGKTEASKRVIRHLVERCRKFNNKQQSTASAGESLEKRLLLVSPILEAIGNASTGLNHNSSRFGKYTKIVFHPEDDGSWKLVRAKIETYLLERSRVSFHEKNERGFHIMHQLVAACDAVPSLGLHLAAGSFQYLGETVDSARLDADRARFQKFQESCKSIGMSETQLDLFLRALAGILHLGNVSIEGDMDESNLVEVPGELQSYQPLKWACDLLGLSKEDLETCFCKRAVFLPGKDGGEVLTGQGKNDAINNRNAVAKAIYSTLFDWMVGQINSALNIGGHQESGKEAFIGVLDIFGFESFQQNNFEQLLINYTNEALQDTFIHQVFTSELDLYRSEGLVIKEDDFKPPQQSGDCLTLFHGKAQTRELGLLGLVDEVAKAPQPTDEKLNQEFHKRLNTHKVWLKPHPRDVRTCFVISHYPGAVKYSVAGFLEKNADNLPDTANMTLAKATNQVIANQFSALCNSNPGAGSKRRRTRTSIVSKFSKQMGELITTLDQTKCSFIRCVKPNVSMQRPERGSWFDRGFVLAQLRCLSIAQTAMVLKSGLPTRIRYASLLDAYGESLPAEALDIWNRLGGGNEREFTKALLWAFDVPKNAYRCGTTRLFFRSGQLSMLDRILDASKTWASSSTADSQSRAERDWVVRRFKLYYVRLLWRKCVVKVNVAQFFLNTLARVRARTRAANTLISFLRMAVCRREFQTKRDAAITIQCSVRCTIALREAALLEQEALERKRMQEELERKHQAEKEQLQLQQQQAALEKQRSEQEAAFAAQLEVDECKADGEDLQEDTPILECLVPSIQVAQVSNVQDEAPVEESPTMERQRSWRQLVRVPSFASTTSRRSRRHSISSRRSTSPSRSPSPRRSSHKSRSAGRDSSIPSAGMSFSDSLAKCTKVADEVLGIECVEISPEAMKKYQEEAEGPAMWEVLAKRLMQIQIIRTREEKRERDQLQSRMTEMNSLLEQSEQRCWEYKVIAAEREARITELTSALMKREHEMKPAIPVHESNCNNNGTVTSDAESLSSMVEIFQAQQLKLVDLTDKLEVAERAREEQVECREYMAKVVDQLTMDLERERMQAQRNFDFFQNKIYELEHQIERRDNLVEDYQMQLAKLKGVLAESLSSKGDDFCLGGTTGLMSFKVTPKIATLDLGTAKYTNHPVA